MKRHPIFWIALGFIVTLVCIRFLRVHRISSDATPDSGTQTLGQAEEPSRAQGPRIPTPTPASTFNPPQLETDDERVRALLERYGLDARATVAAHRAAWQASEFRRLTPSNPLAQTAYLDLLNDRERLHLELEFGITNQQFLGELFALDLESQPKAQPAQPLASTEASAFLHEYHLKTQGNTEPMKRTREVLEKHGLSGFPLLLRAVEDVALLEACLERHRVVDAGREALTQRQAAGDPNLSTELAANVELDVANSISGIQAMESVLSRSYATLSGIQDPAFPSEVRAAAAGTSIELHPIRPPPNAREILQLLESQTPPPGPTAPPTPP